MLKLSVSFVFLLSTFFIGSTRAEAVAPTRCYDLFGPSTRVFVATQPSIHRHVSFWVQATALKMSRGVLIDEMYQRRYDSIRFEFGFPETSEPVVVDVIPHASDFGDFFGFYWLKTIDYQERIHAETMSAEQIKKRIEALAALQRFHSGH